MRSMVFQAARVGCVAGLAALALAACGEDTATTEDTASAADDPLAPYTACLTEQGIELPEDWTPFGEGGMPGGEMPTGEMPADGEMPTGEMPTDGEMPTGDMPAGPPGGGAIAAPEGVDEADWTAATEACADQLPQGGGMPGGTPPEQENATEESVVEESPDA
ncbi:hypothetical protein [Glycomyces rhizosphaerae]|uniref:PT repeat-containing protein n=1 Tax=Glycomyces rhizosphaerae TaxID=2054422 RepID=A0ABV7PXW6_9ACTN